MQTDNQKFKNPHTSANKIGRMLWHVVWLLLFRPTPQFLGAWRSFLLKMFGAKIKFARVHASVRIWAPWKLELGEHVYVDRDVNLYNVYGITLHDRVIVSIGSFLCGASHDYSVGTYPLIGGPIVVESDSWIAAEAFVAPGVKIGQGAVVGARAVVTRDVPEWTVVAGNPAKVIKQRQVQPPCGQTPEASA